MSFTAAYTQLRAIRDGEVQNASRTRGHPRIVDPDGFGAVHEHVDMSETTLDKITITGEETDHGEYPTQTWETLKGFKSWKPTDAFGLDHGPEMSDLISKIKHHEDYRTGPLGYGYNIERVGIPYEGMDGVWRRLFAEVSKYTEPFAFYHSRMEHEFPDVTDFAGGFETVYYVEADDGDLYCEEQTLARVGCETKIDEKPKTAVHETQGGDE